MSTFKERLNEEYNQLNEKIEKLEWFLLSEKLNEVVELQKSLLKVQLMSMKTYSGILYERLSSLE